MKAEDFERELAAVHALAVELDKELAYERRVTTDRGHTQRELPDGFCRRCGQPRPPATGHRVLVGALPFWRCDPVIAKLYEQRMRREGKWRDPDVASVEQLPPRFHTAREFGGV